MTRAELQRLFDSLGPYWWVREIEPTRTGEDTLLSAAIPGVIVLNDDPPEPGTVYIEFTYEDPYILPIKDVHVPPKINRCERDGSHALVFTRPNGRRMEFSTEPITDDLHGKITRFFDWWLDAKPGRLAHIAGK
ncbi:MAG: hypothetical protein R2878_02655 [Thermoleophilia bacterium]